MLEKPWILVPKSPIVHSFVPMSEFAFLMVMNKETVKALVLSGFGAVDSLDGPMDYRALLHDNAKIHFPRGSLWKFLFGDDLGSRFHCSLISEIDFDQVPSTGGSRKDQKSRFVLRTMMYTNGLEIKCLVNDRLEQKPRVLEPGGSLTDLAKTVKKKSKLLPFNELPIDVAHIKRVIGIDTGEKYAVGCSMKLVDGYQKVDNKLAYNGDISNLVIKSKALSEPTRKYSKWLQGKKTAEIFELERSLEKRTAENWSDYTSRWKPVYDALSLFYNSKAMKKKRWDHQKAIRQQWDQAVNGILKMTGAGMKQKSDGSTAFCFGNCTMSGKGVYSSFTRYLVKKLKELGYDLYSRDEFNTSQMFPELGERVIEAGNDKIRIKYCPSIKVHIH